MIKFNCKIAILSREFSWSFHWNNLSIWINHFDVWWILILATEQIEYYLSVKVCEQVPILFKSIKYRLSNFDFGVLKFYNIRFGCCFKDWTVSDISADGTSLDQVGLKILFWKIRPCKSLYFVHSEHKLHATLSVYKSFSLLCHKSF